MFPTINPYLGRLGQEAHNLERQLAPQQQEVTTLRENATRPFRFAADLAASRLELTAVQGRLREWNAAEAALSRGGRLHRKNSGRDGLAAPGQ